MKIRVRPVTSTLSTRWIWPFCYVMAASMIGSRFTSLIRLRRIEIHTQCGATDCNTLLAPPCHDRLGRIAAIIPHICEDIRHFNDNLTQ